MNLLLRATALYLLVGGAFVAVFRDNPLTLLGDIGRALPSSFAYFLHYAWWVLPPFAVMFVLLPRSALLARLSSAIVAVFTCSLFFLVFTMLKTSMPFVIPFWADPFFASLDRALHFGVDPWVWTQKLASLINPDIAHRIYVTFWLGPAMYLPVLLFLFDGDQARIRRFLWLYFFVWIGLGNLLALGFMSAGPVYYDRLLGGEIFAPLTEALAASGVTDSATGRAQAWLWDVYSAGRQEAGTGISAFPSVHIGMVTLLALYMWERSRWLVLPGVVLVSSFQFLSVFLGWHYAVDGYFSILAVIGVWWGLRRWQNGHIRA